MGAIRQASEADMMNKALQCKDRRIANGVPLALDALGVKTKKIKTFSRLPADAEAHQDQPRK